MKEKHYFASANTGKGFINYFNYINDENREGYLYILKGGPGTGKSTIMKKVGKYFSDLGHDIEYFHCSSDVESLDAVRLPFANIAIVDGTAPHVTEASLPEVKERIVNLGEFIGTDIKKYSNQMQPLLKKKKEMFDIAYKYISSIYELMQINAQLTKKERSGAGNLKLKKYGKKGRERKLFYAAITNSGNVSMVDSGQYTVQYAKNLSMLRDVLIDKGYEITSFYNNIMPEKIEGILIENIGLYILEKEGKKISKKAVFLKNQELIANLTRLAGKALSEAKKAHKQIESFYIKHMDFAGLDKTTDYLIGDIIERI